MAKKKGYGCGMGIRKKFDKAQKKSGGNPSVFDAAKKAKQNRKKKKAQLDQL